MTERAISPESAKDATSNGRMGELALSNLQEIIPKEPSYLTVANVNIDYYKIRQKFGDNSEQALAAKRRYEEYLSRMDPEEYGVMIMKYNSLVGGLPGNSTE